MDSRYVLLFFGIMILVVASMQVYNTLSYESSVGEWGDAYYMNYIKNTPKELQVANIYSAYTEGWRTHANVNPVFPAFILVSFFGWIGYMYYKDWEIGKMKNIRRFLGVKANGL